MSRPALSDKAIHCRDLVGKVRPDQSLLAVLAPAPARPSLWAIAAFDWEVARIPDLVSEPLMGAIRRQWWREAWEEIVAGVPRRHPVVEALAEAHRLTPFRLSDVERYLDGRETEHEGPPDDLPAMQERARLIGGSLAFLESTAVGEGRDAAECAGAGWFLVSEVCHLPQRLRSGRHGLPAQRMSQLDTPIEQTDPARLPADLTALIREVATTADDEFNGANVSRPLFRGYVRLAQLYRHRLQRAGWNPFDSRILAPTVGRAGSVLRVRLGV